MKNNEKEFLKLRDNKGSKEAQKIIKKINEAYLKTKTIDELFSLKKGKNLSTIERQQIFDELNRKIKQVPCSYSLFTRHMKIPENFTWKNITKSVQVLLDNAKYVDYDGNSKRIHQLCDLININTDLENIVHTLRQTKNLGTTDQWRLHTLYKIRYNELKNLVKENNNGN